MNEFHDFHVVRSHSHRILTTIRHVLVQVDCSVVLIFILNVEWFNRQVRDITCVSKNISFMSTFP